MGQPSKRRLCWLTTAMIVAASAISAPSASAQPDPSSARGAEAGMPSPALQASPSLGSAVPVIPSPHLETLNDCMNYWDAQTHMSRSEWQAACQRTLNGAVLD
jgi:hypothetical protein